MSEWLEWPDDPCEWLPDPWLVVDAEASLEAITARKARLVSSPLEDMVLDLSADVVEVRLEPVEDLVVLRGGVCLKVVGPVELTPGDQPLVECVL